MKRAVVSWRGHVYRILLVWVLALIAYSNSFQAGLVFDSGNMILRDTRIRAGVRQTSGES